MIKRLHNLSDEEKFICQKYVDNGRNEELTAKEVNKTLATFKKIIERPKCQTFITWRSSEKERKSKLDFNYKLYKLRRIIDAFVPDDLEKEINSKEASVAVSAIDQSNKMQGHFSAEKIVSANFNCDVVSIDTKRVMDELIAKHQQDH